jgi:hypothetical protein
MKPRKLLRRAYSRKFPLNNLLDELFHMVLEQVDKQDLLDLYLVSRGLYLRVALILYRNISLNLRRASHRQLLRHHTFELASRSTYDSSNFFDLTVPTRSNLQ